MHSEIGQVRQNPIQRPVRTAHLSVLMTVHRASIHNTTQNSSDNVLLPPDKHHSSDVVCWRRGDFTQALNASKFWSITPS